MRPLASTLKQKLSVEDAHMYHTGREMVPPVSYRMENCVHLSAWNFPRKQPHHWKGKLVVNVFARRKKKKKRGQVVKNISILYLLDPGGTHRLGILKMSCKTYTCLSATAQTFCCKLWTVQIIKIFHFSNHSCHFHYCWENSAAGGFFFHRCHRYRSPSKANLSWNTLMGINIHFWEKKETIFSKPSSRL